MISINIWVAVVGGSFALIGAVIGSALTRTNEHRQWLRNEKAEAYRHYLEHVALPAPQNFFQILGNEKPEDDPYEPTVLTFFASVYSAAMRVMLIAPAKIGDEVNEHLDRMGAILAWYNDVPAELREKYYHADLNGNEKKSADERLRAEAFTQITARMEKFTGDSVEHSNRVATYMRWDLKPTDHLPWGRISSLIRWSADKVKK